MNITRETIKSTLRTIMAEESEYQTFFKKALEKAGKSIPSMSDEEKKEFFNKIDAAWNAKGEKNEGNAFGAAVVAAKEKGEDEFEVGGKTYKVESVNESIKYKDVKKGDVLYSWIYGSKKGAEREYFKVKILEPISDEPGYERFRAKQLDGLKKGKTIVVWLDTLSKKANESVNEDYNGPAILKLGDKNLLKVGEKITINTNGKKKEYKVVKSKGNGDFVLNVVESVNEADVKKKINRRGDVDGLLVKHNGEEYEIVYSDDFDMGGAVQPYGIVMPGDDVVSFLGKDKKAKSIWKQLKPKVDKFLKSNESVEESHDCGCGCGGVTEGGCQTNVNEAASDRDFDKVFNIFNKKDYFHLKGSIKTMLGNWQRALDKGDKGAQKYSEQDIINAVTSQTKARAKQTYDSLVKAIKDKDINSLKSKLRHDQPFSIAIFTQVTGKKLPKSTRDIHSFLDNEFMGESITEGRAFINAAKKAKAEGKTEFEFNGKTYPVTIKEEVNEGKKVFRINPGIGKAKYSISSHDGVKKHKDGSDFFDIEIFKNKVDLEKGIKKYKSKGFVEESVISEDASMNKKVKAYLDKGLSDLTKGKPNHHFAVMHILKGALTDANFHSEAKQVEKIFPKGKYEGDPRGKQDAIGIYEEMGENIASICKWDGKDIVDAIGFYVSMTIGRPVGEKVEKLVESINETINLLNNKK